jgi:20S proteasome alpha/beta subunit
MSLGIAFKGPEGIVLAADSRVTLNRELMQGTEKIIIPSTFDNATKLLKFQNHDYVGAVTYGAGAIGAREPRTAHSFLPEFDRELAKEGAPRLSVEGFAKKLSDFFLARWSERLSEAPQNIDMIFMVGGFDEDAPYGRVYQFAIPGRPVPFEQQTDVFGLTWGGQLGYTSRLIKGWDPQLPDLVQKHLSLTDEQKSDLTSLLDSNLSLRIPYQFLPLQDCVDLAIFLIRTSIEIQRWLVDIRGVGGAIDVATITRTEGFKYIQQKAIIGQRNRT